MFFLSPDFFGETQLLPIFFKNGTVCYMFFFPRGVCVVLPLPQFLFHVFLKPNSSIYHIIAQYGPHQPMAGSRNSHFGLGHEYDSCAGLSGCHSKESMFDSVRLKFEDR